MRTTSDITTRADVVRMVDTFYDLVREDDILGPIFGGVARVDWAAHLPKMYDFWEAVLFGRATFKGNPLAVHLALSRLTPLTNREFDRWIALFHATVEGLFEVDVVDIARLRASRIAATMQHHLAERHALTLITQR
jgi:hemoglobin